jgi:hypothetical protein
MMVSFPTIISCVFAAYLHGGPDLGKHSYEPIMSPTEDCRFAAWIKEGEFHIERNGQEVFIPVPNHTGWYRFQYYWGQDFAYLSVPGGKSWYHIPIRIGSADYY